MISVIFQVQNPLPQFPIWLASAIGSALISIIISLILADSIKAVFYKIFKVGKLDPIPGLWIAEYTFPKDDGNEEKFTEIIKIKKSFGGYAGNIQPDARNYQTLKAVEHKSPRRLRAEKISDKLLTGIWFHPVAINHNHGSFQLSISSDGQTMNGIWVGSSQQQDKIISGSWSFSRAI